MCRNVAMFSYDCWSMLLLGSSNNSEEAAFPVSVDIAIISKLYKR